MELRNILNISENAYFSIDKGPLICYNTFTMKYMLMIESHSDAPDIEREVEAQTKEEAINVFYDWLKDYGWEKSVIARSVIADDEFIS